MDFNSHKENAKKLGVGGEYYRLEDGENKFRILTMPEPTQSHYLGKGVKPASCTGPGCKCCADGVKVVHKILLYVLDRRDGTAKPAEFPFSIYTALGELANGTEYSFTGLPPYDLIVMKSGKDLETKYAVTPGRDETPVDITELLKGKKSIVDMLLSRGAPKMNPNGTYASNETTGSAPTPPKYTGEKGVKEDLPWDL